MKLRSHPRQNLGEKEELLYRNRLPTKQWYKAMEIRLPLDFSMEQYLQSWNWNSLPVKSAFKWRKRHFRHGEILKVYHLAKQLENDSSKMNNGLKNDIPDFHPQLSKIIGDTYGALTTCSLHRLSSFLPDYSEKGTVMIPTLKRRNW